MTAEPATALKRDRALPDWVQVALVNLGAALLVVLAFSGVTWRTPWQKVMEAFAVAYLISTCIGFPCAYLLPRLVHAIDGRVRFPYTWGILITAMIGLAIAGSVAAIAVGWVFGYIPSAYVPQWIGGSMRIEIIVTLIFGIFTTVIAIGQSRLDAATLALRTKERDEAEARRIASEAQLASLESRVNPHFFFNTLNSIAALTRDDAVRAERMTTQLASLMRSSLDQSSRPLVALAQELQNVRDYLDIEHVRFGDRLRYDITVNQAAGRTLVPRLALQTLVENSVKYAVSPRREGASVTVSAVRTNGRLRVDVTDDGPGFDNARLPDGHGLALIRARLEMLYGGDASLSINSEPGRTTVAMDVPASDAV